MGRRLRYLPERALVEVTCRTGQGRLLLRPGVCFNELALGALGRSQARYGMRLHAFVVLSGHLHLLLSPESPQQLAAFMQHFLTNLAKEAGREHQWKGKIFERRYQAIVVADEEEAQAKRLLYILRHGVKEHLVSRSQDWPGPHSVTALLEGAPLTGLWISRTLERRLEEQHAGKPFDRRLCESIETITLSPLPCWAHLAAVDYRARVADLVALVEAEGARLREEKGAPLGRDRILRQNPHELPMKSKRSWAPFAHAASRAAYQALRDAYRAFVRAYRAAADQLRSTPIPVAFPDRSFPPPLRFVT